MDFETLINVEMQIEEFNLEDGEKLLEDPDYDWSDKSTDEENGDDK